MFVGNNRFICVVDLARNVQSEVPICYTNAMAIGKSTNARTGPRPAARYIQEVHPRSVAHECNPEVN